ncbi:hypothetical protein P879_03086 [Paragonimus westermani]|uniref:Deoxyribodipyrimidine photo-lyase n=1 Tax=Paragonimus westermani TaxID=34504 RepID=A0A8T0DIF5_9TREM|nr:hypothetical protein P879_03086 [Paragonimus westermani]
MMSAVSGDLKLIAKTDLVSWTNNILQRRHSLGGSVRDFPFAKCRVRQLKGPNLFPELDGATTTDKVGMGGVLYWMIRDHRVQDNWAFLYAQRLALKFGVPLHACFCLSPRYQADTLRHFAFMLEGLSEVEEECNQLNIPFHLVQAKTAISTVSTGMKRTLSDTGHSEGNFYELAVAKSVLTLVRDLRIGCVVTDFCPLREPTAWIEMLLKLVPEEVPVCQVDAHNVVPVWYASDKLEYAARTIRRKLHDKATGLWTEFPPLIAHPHLAKSTTSPQRIVWSDLRTHFPGDCQVKPVKWAKGGSKAGLEVLFDFLSNRLHLYDKNRNDPTKVAQSGLSPWLHFGQLAPQRVLLEARAVRNVHAKSADAFIEEIFVRRELADNFCFYNPRYDSLDGAYKWAQDTLHLHAKDTRNPAYTDAQMETAKTKDDLWNACQHQLVHMGKMHGFLRMYWAKKILEWHNNGPEAALRLALYLNDRYSLDGSDPNGVVGVMWSICGVHDQGWAERAIFGKIRCMTYKGCQNKFSIPTFVAKQKNNAL